MKQAKKSSTAQAVGRSGRTGCSAQDRLVICDHANDCPMKNQSRLGLDYCSGIKPHLRGYVLDTPCVDGHICRGIPVRCVEVPTPNNPL